MPYSSATGVSYEAATECVRAMGRVRPFELAARLGIDWRIAAGHLARMQREGLVSRMDFRGWRHARPHPDANLPSAPASGFSVRSDGRSDGRFDAMRRIIAKELHPDFCDSDDGSRAVRAELFKRIWPQLAAISHAAA